MSFLPRTLPLLTLVFALAAGAHAQGMPTPPPEVETPEVEEAPTEASAEARAAYAAAIEAAEAAEAQGTAAGHAEAAEAYARAAEIARTSGDAELEAVVGGTLEAAIRARVNAASVLAGQNDYAGAATQFEAAAALAAELDNAELRAQLTSNAATAHIQAEAFDRAVATLDAVIAEQEDNLDLRHLRAQALLRAGRTDAAAEALLDLRDRARAAGDEQNLARANEAAGRIHLMAARDAIQAENFRQAIEALDRAAEFLPENDVNLHTFYANAYYRLGVNQVRAEQWAAARASLQRAQEHARIAGRDQIVTGAQQQLDFIRQVQG